MLDKIADVWKTFRDTYKHPLPIDLTVLQFGNTATMANELGSLVMDGQKIATSSLVQLNEYYNRKSSQVGDCYVLMDGTQECLGFLQVVQTETRNFSDITQQFAEEEGDETFENWLAIHQAYYQQQMTLIDDALSPDTQLHCEWFKVICDLR